MEEKANRNFRKTRTGVVVSDKMEKTAVIRIDRKVKHPIYGKAMKRSKKFKIHDEKNQCHVGDSVRIAETRPLSKEKCWRLVEVISTAKQ